MPATTPHSTFEFHIDQLSPKQKTKLWMRLLAAAGAMLFLVFLMAAFMYRFKMFVLPRYQSGFLEKVAQALPGQFKPIIKPNLRPQPSPIEEIILKWKISHTTGDQVSQVLSGDVNRPVFWARKEDDLYYLLDSTDENSELRLEVHKINLETKSESIIAQKTLGKVFKTQLTVDNFQIIDNTLLIGFGGYLKTGRMDWLDLDAEHPVFQTLIEEKNPKFEQIKGKYWLTAGEGDACWGEKDYYLYNESARTLKKIVDTGFNCEEGESFLGVDDQNRILLGYRQATNGDSFDTKFLSISAVHIDQPSVKEGVVSNQEMPVGVELVEYFEKQNSLLLIANQLSIFDLKAQQVTAIANLPDKVQKGLVENTTYLDHTTDHGACFLDSLDNTYYEINISQKTFVFPLQECDQEKLNAEKLKESNGGPNYFYRRTITKAFEELALPDSYQLSFE